MKKTILTVLAFSLLTACNDDKSSGSSGSSGSEPEVTDTRPTEDSSPEQGQSTPEKQSCIEKDSVISLPEGTSCLLSSEQRTRLNISGSSEVLSCSEGRVKLGEISAGRLLGNGLTALCSSNKSPTPDTSDPVKPKPDSQYCSANNNVISLMEGQSCRLSANQLTQLNITMSGDQLRCTKGRLQLGGISAGRLTGNGLSAQCSTSQPPVNSTPAVQDCIENNAVISIENGTSCRLSQAHLSQLNIRMGGDQLRCIAGRLHLGGISAGRLSTNGLTVQCVSAPGVHHQQSHATTSTQVTWYLPGEVSALKKFTVYGNAEPVIYGESEYAQVHSNMLSGVFHLQAAVQGLQQQASKPQQLRLAITQAGKLYQDTEVHSLSAAVDTKLIGSDIKCIYTEQGQVMCGNFELALDSVTDKLPAKINLHLLQCDKSAMMRCSSGIIVPIQFN